MTHTMKKLNKDVMNFFKAGDGNHAMLIACSGDESLYAYNDSPDEPEVGMHLFFAMTENPVLAEQVLRAVQAYDKYVEKSLAGEI